MKADEKFEELKNEFFEQFIEKNPDAASFLGLHDPYDFLLPKGDTQHILDNYEMLKTAVKRMHETIPFNELNDANKIDWQILEKSIEPTRFAIFDQRRHELNPNVFEQLGSMFFLMISKDYAPLENRIKAIISRIELVPKFLEEFRSRFEDSNPVRLWTEIAIETAQQMPGLFHFIAALSKGKIPDDIHGRLEEAINTVMQPLQEHMTWLQTLKSRTIEEWALGKEKFERLIELRDLGMSSEEILQLGVRYLEELKQEKQRIAAQINSDLTFDEIMKQIEQNAPQTFEDALDATRKAMMDAKQFLIDHDLATIYEEDKLLVEETPAFLTPLIPFAALMMPSRFDSPMIGVYVVTRPKDSQNLGKHLNYPGLLNTAVHEAYPGHFLQGTISNRSSIVHILKEGFGTTQGTETVEGWAHYCEQMMMEKGFISGLEAKLIQITAVIWRAVRIIVDVKLSRGEMSFDDAVDMLMKEAGLSKEAAVAEVRWYTQLPSYPLSYLLGKHMILKLRDEVRQKMGAHYTDKIFHDTITANGYLPVSLLRSIFEQKIAKIKS